MAIRYRKELLEAARAAYDAAGPAQKRRIATLLLRVRGDARRSDGSWIIPNQSVFDFMRSLQDDDARRWAVVLNVARFRINASNGLSRASVGALTTYLQSVEAGLAAIATPTQDQAVVLREIRAFLTRVLHIRSEAEPAQQAIAGLDFTSASEAALDALAESWGEIPEDIEDVVAADEMPPDNS